MSYLAGTVLLPVDLSPVSRYTLLGSACHSLLVVLLLASTVAITVRHL
jgi:hypothetical protein